MTDDLDDPPLSEPAPDEEARSGLLGDSIRKAVVSGMTALFMTEEGIRNALGDMRLPKDALAYLSQQTERTRRELFRAVSAELKSFLSGIDLSRALRKALSGMKVEVRAELRFTDEGAPKGEVTTRVADAEAEPRRRRRAKPVDGQ